MIRDPFTLGSRTLDFSQDILDFCKNERQTYVTKPLIDQLIRSATSIGANYAEANNAASKSDFKNKIYIAKKEAAETEYWLKLLCKLVEDEQLCLKLLEECHYLLMTFQKIINTLSRGKLKTANVR
ncbi:MAG TPA: four helix bundle protein [Candidatus Saccharimonadales bacterium]|nr:four helix bundle protein [Candidatus Saccharimonadales bacterium]